MIMQADTRQLLHLKALLHSFAESTGLKVNFHKSCLIPINVSQDRVPILTQTFGCAQGSLPFTYLGKPLGTTKPLVKDYAPLICRIERKLSGSSSFLNYAGRLQLVNSVISTLPTYYMCTLSLPQAVIEMIDKFQKKCLWRGSDPNAKGYNLAAWNMVTVPKLKGGLGVKDLYLQNEALLIKHLAKFYNKANIPWISLVWEAYYQQKVTHLTAARGSFWWKDILKLNAKFGDLAHCIFGKGNSVGLWHDVLFQQPLSATYPHLFQYAVNQNISLGQGLMQTYVLQLFRLPMSTQAYNEFLEFRINLGQLRGEYNEEQSHVWTCNWSGGLYVASKFYKRSF